MYHGCMGGPPGTHGKLLNHEREFAVCVENMHGYTEDHVPRSISVISHSMVGPQLQCKVTGT